MVAADHNHAGLRVPAHPGNLGASQDFHGLGSGRRRHQIRLEAAHGHLAQAALSLGVHAPATAHTLGPHRVCLVQSLDVCWEHLLLLARGLAAQLQQQR